LIGAVTKIGSHFAGNHAPVQKPLRAFFEVIRICVCNGKRRHSFFRAL
jgi:hypothetical protein